MRGLWCAVRCSLGLHRWQTISVGAERGRECQDCEARDFDGPTRPDLDDVKEAARNFSGGSGFGSM